jgi:hypothetical protein
MRVMVIVKATKESEAVPSRWKGPKRCSSRWGGSMRS